MLARPSQFAIQAVADYAKEIEQIRRNVRSSNQDCPQKIGH
jgi:hypothetical protein